MSKIKIGDKVRVITTRHGSDQHLDEGVVTRTNRMGSFDIEVNFTSPYATRKQQGHFNQYASRDVEVIERFTKEPAPKVDTRRVYSPNRSGYVVMLHNEDGTLAPSENPAIHNNLLDAEKEATRLSKAHGKPFVVFGAVAMMVPETITKTITETVTRRVNVI